MVHTKALLAIAWPLATLSSGHFILVSVSLSSAYTVVIGVVATIPASKLLLLVLL